MGKIASKKAILLERGTMFGGGLVKARGFEFLPGLVGLMKNQSG
jgi:hypothetical protein